MTTTMLRELALTADGTLPPNKIPPELAVSRPREGGPIEFEWRADFVDAEGVVVAGGQATVQWHTIEIFDPDLSVALKAGPYAYRQQPPVRTAPLGAPVTVESGDIETGVIFSKGWPWPRVTDITAPEIAPKSIMVTVALNAVDGTYAIAVDEDEPLEFEASGNTPEEIRDGLVALFVGHALLDVTPDAAVNKLLLTAQQPSVDFELTTLDPDRYLTQQVVDPLVMPATGLRLYMIVVGAAALPAV